MQLLNNGTVDPALFGAPTSHVENPLDQYAAMRVGQELLSRHRGMPMPEAIELYHNHRHELALALSTHLCDMPQHALALHRVLRTRTLQLRARAPLVEVWTRMEQWSAGVTQDEQDGGMFTLLFPTHSKAAEAKIWLLTQGKRELLVDVVRWDEAVHPELPGGTKTRYREHILSLVPVMTMPVIMKHGGPAHWQHFLMPNLVGASTDQITTYFAAQCELLQMDQARAKMAFASQSEFSALRNASGISAEKMLDFAVLNFGAPGLAAELGVSDRRAREANRAFWNLADVLPSIQQEAQANVDAKQAARAAGGKAPIKHVAKAVTWQERKLIMKRNVLKHVGQSAAAHQRKKTLQIPGLEAAFVALAEMKGGESKDAHDAPTNAIFLRVGTRGEPQLDDFLALARHMGKQLSPPVSIGEAAVRSALVDAGIKFNKPRNVDRAHNISSHYAADEVLLGTQFYLLFSSITVQTAVDAMANHHCHSSENNKKRCYMSSARPKTTMDHEANTVSSKCSLSLFTLFLQPANSGVRAARLPQPGKQGCPVDFAWSDHIAGYDPAMMQRDREAHVYQAGHVESRDKESALRNVRDLAGLLDDQPQLFERKDLDGGADSERVCFLVIITDNGHGPREAAFQFVSGLLWLAYDLDGLLIDAYAGGQSVYNPAERPHGAVAVPVNGTPIPIDGMEALSNMSNDELDVLLDSLVVKLCARASLAKMKSLAGGFVKARPAVAPTTFAFGIAELRNFLKGSANVKASFVYDAGPDYQNGAECAAASPQALLLLAPAHGSCPCTTTGIYAQSGR